MNHDKFVIGVDENNYSPSIAGPVTVTALYPIKFVPGVNDSKRLAARKRVALYARIQKNSIYAVVPANIVQIRELGIYEARNIAIVAAVRMLLDTLGRRQIDRVQVDGKWSRNLMERFVAETNQYWEEASDANDYAVAAASIIGKEYTDIMFMGAGATWQGYGMEHDHGSPGEAHKQALRSKGPSPWHRPRNYASDWWHAILNNE